MFKEFINSYFGQNEKKQIGFTPMRRDYIIDSKIEEEIYNKGYAITGKIESSTIDLLISLYKETHNFNVTSGGMFYSVYSQDITYREKVHAEIGSILKSYLEKLFINYRSVLNSFIIKVSGPESEFSLHQDSTSIDELSFSNLSLWIPLQDTDLKNGCLNVVPFSHKMFSPYRGMSIESPFQDIANTVRKYLQPIELQKGEILLFDNRLVHNSAVNSSGKDRVVVMCGIYPKTAPLLSCFKDPTNKNSPIELIKQDENYLLTYPNFKENCHCRPTTGVSEGFINWESSSMKESDFLSLCKKYNLQETNIPSLTQSAKNQSILDSANVTS